MLILSPADYRTVPWKNGGGITTELYVESAPSGSGQLDFLWRVSIADVASDGPFSRFAGYDRHIMCVEGQGMVLHGIPSGPGDVIVPFSPFRFSGDWTVSASLVSGPVRDFNLIARRGRLKSSLACLVPIAALELGSEATEFTYLFEGELQASGVRLIGGYSLLLRPGEKIRLECASARPPRLAYCRMTEITR